jgi:hypothetical protein
MPSVGVSTLGILGLLQILADDGRNLFITRALRVFDLLAIQARRPCGVDICGGQKDRVHGSLRFQKPRNGPTNALRLRQILLLGKFLKALQKRGGDTNVQRNRAVRCILCVIRVGHGTTVLRRCVDTQ